MNKHYVVVYDVYFFHNYFRCVAKNKREARKQAHQCGIPDKDIVEVYEEVL